MVYTNSVKTKVCNCIGGDNCNDENCEIVKRHRAKMKGIITEVIR